MPTAAPISARAHLDRVDRQARAIVPQVEALVEGLEPRALLWRPAPERWGIADCLEHLIATGKGYHPRIRTALENARPPGPGPVYRPRLFGRWFIRSAGPEGRMRIRARGPFVPPPAMPDAPQRFVELQDDFLELIESARGADLQRTKVPSPLTRLLTLTLGECLEMLVVHQARHLAQARRVRSEPGFPRD